MRPGHPGRAIRQDHMTQGRADGHLFITVLAYQLVQTIRRRLRGHGETSSWATLRRVLASQQRVTATFRRKDGTGCVPRGGVGGQASAGSPGQWPATA